MSLAANDDIDESAVHGLGGSSARLAPAASRSCCLDVIHTQIKKKQVVVGRSKTPRTCDTWYSQPGHSLLSWPRLLFSAEITRSVGFGVQDAQASLDQNLYLSLIRVDFHAGRDSFEIQGSSRAKSQDIQQSKEGGFEKVRSKSC